MNDAAVWAALACVAMFTLAAISVPISALAWWAGWRRRTAPEPPLRPEVPPTEGPFLVYLSGVGDISGEYSTRYEDTLLEEVRARVPGLQVIIDVFGFSVENLSMTSERTLGWLWRWLNDLRLRKGPFKPAGKLINLRNILHIAVSADRRYGPVYNYGVAEMIVQGLLRHGYRLGSGAPVTLLGYSGGVQIALGTSGYLQATLRAPVQVVSLAGVMNSHRSLDRISALTHIYGTRDYQHHLGDVIFPARWPIFPGSRWGRALVSGKIRRVCLGPMKHAGRGGYLDAGAQLADGRSHLAATADTIGELIRNL